VRLVSHQSDGCLRAGVLAENLVVDLEAAAGAAATSGHDDAVIADASVRGILIAPEEDRAAIADAAAELARAGEVVAALDQLVLGPPVPDPQKILCVGLNYVEHASEMALEETFTPTLFPKFANALIGSGSAIMPPHAARQVDYEGELAVVVGRRCRNVTPERALEYVAGYMPFNDVSARDLQMATSQWTAGKIADTFAPCGPALVLRDEVPDPQALSIETRVNGRTLQSASTAQMIFGVAETISFVSTLVTLEVGDIIATGTPAGVGYRREPPIFLDAGDVVEVEIAGLGRLVNPVAALPADGWPSSRGQCR
jgi:acylpyruvate hydrolase